KERKSSSSHFFIRSAFVKSSSFSSSSNSTLGKDKIFEQQKTFSDLRRNIDNLEKNSVTSLGTPVNLGSEVYMQADIPDTKRIFVDIGLGFHVEFTWSETINYISQREEKLSRQTEEYTRLIASINARSSCLLDLLIDNEHDVKDLRAAGVLRNSLSSDGEAAQLINRIGSNCFAPPVDKYEHVKYNIEKHYKRKCTIWTAQVWYAYFSSPLTVLALIAAAVVLVLTAVQTWYAVNPKN
ncbi:protein UXT homolog, partial [Morus notabilis]|uniref:protein UXT homolog n=1 Tax=Morus notabilis TaxID=981085 RepID=UPI000CECED3E